MGTVGVRGAVHRERLRDVTSKRRPFAIDELRANEHASQRVSLGVEGCVAECPAKVRQVAYV